MNFLQLVQELRREAGVSGDIVTVSNQRGEAERLVRWVARAYQDICLEEFLNWKFLRKHVAVQLTEDQGRYTATDLGITDFGQWDIKTPRVAMNADFSDETFIEPMTWTEFRNYWLFSSRRDIQSQPLNCAISPDDELIVGPKPSAAYWIDLEYIADPSELEADEDIPLIPKRFHMLIVWRALRSYGMFESAPEVVARAEDAMNEMQLRLTLDQTDQITLGDPLC